MIRKFLLWATRNRPMKAIEVGGKLYLERYYMGGLAGYQVWLHRFRSADGDRHLHSHPWSAYSLVLAGGYVEHVRSGGATWGRSRKAWGGVLRITPDYLHRIVAVEPDTWTLMIVGPARLPTWHFIDGDTREEMVASDLDWWRKYPPRRESLDGLLAGMAKAKASRGAIQAIQRECWLRTDEWVFIGRGQ